MIISGTILYNILTVIMHIHFITFVHVIAAHIYHTVRTSFHVISQVSLDKVQCS